MRGLGPWCCSGSECAFGRAAPVGSFTSGVNVAVSGGVSVTISGLMFGSSCLTASATLGSTVDCSTTAWSSATTLQCFPGSVQRKVGDRLIVSVGGVVGTSALPFSFDGTAGEAHGGACRLCWLRGAVRGAGLGSAFGEEESGDAWAWAVVL